MKNQNLSLATMEREAERKRAPRQRPQEGNDAQRYRGQ
jgi:hypothetical protein